MLEVAFDINVIRPFLLQEPRQGDSLYLEIIKTLWEAAKSGRIEGWVTAFSLPIIFSQSEQYYYTDIPTKRPQLARESMRKLARAYAYRDVRKCINVLQRCDLTDDDILETNNLMTEDVACNDFEDNLQLVCACRAGLDIIVTDNLRDFSCARSYGVDIVTPSQLLKRI